MKKNLLGSHKELLKLKQEKMSEKYFEFKQSELNTSNTIDMIAKELGIPGNELDQWKLVNNEYFIKSKKKNEPSKT